jgi:hypothetical protein
VISSTGPLRAVRMSLDMYGPPDLLTAAKLSAVDIARNARA